jgi:serine/threonine protein kinase
MDYASRWQKIGQLGEGGQGKVYRVRDNNRSNIDRTLRQVEDVIKNFGKVSAADSREHREKFRGAILDIVDAENPANHGALKVLHEPKEARDAELAWKRIKREIEAMSQVSHPNVLHILDYDPDGKWHVSQFHSKGTLEANKGRFTGDFVRALRAFRPLVEGVSTLHKAKIVHRDIKPKNVFVDSGDNLVLGDFGLIFFTDVEHSRISDTFTNVGSHDWMPGWGMGMRIHDVRATFDVFSLGKLLWAMISDIPVLRLWYFKDPEFDLEQMFPTAPYIELANELFKKCLVERENACLPDAGALLQEVDGLLSLVEHNAEGLHPGRKRRCRVCGRGDYEWVTDGNRVEMFDFGLRPEDGDRFFKILVCRHCGNVQLFAFRDNKIPPAWSE